MKGFAPGKRAPIMGNIGGTMSHAPAGPTMEVNGGGGGGVVAPGASKMVVNESCYRSSRSKVTHQPPF